MGERVRITDVSPRDGLQNEPGLVPTPDKAELVRLLGLTGVDEVEVTSFVSAKWVPQLGDAQHLLELLSAGPATQAPIWSALVPNERGLSAAIETRRLAAPAGPSIRKVSVFTAASETFSQRNTNASIAETIERFRPVVAGSRGEGLMLRAYVSCAIACPFEGAVPPAKVAAVSGAMASLGIEEIDLGDTIGAGTPQTVTAMLREVAAAVRDHPASPWLTLHLHDTFGRASDCVRAALDLGVRSFDGSVAGLGGCPYASRPGRPAPGNIDTLLLVRTIHGAGYETGVDIDALARAAEFARTVVARSRAATPATPEHGP